MIRLSRPARHAGTLVSVLVAAALVAGCSSGGGSIKVTGSWARASSATTAAGAAYLTIQNTGSSADALVGVSTPAAGTAEVHETFVMGSATPPASLGAAMGSPMPSPSGLGGSGMMGMRPIARLEVPAGGTIELKPGSYHIMLMELKAELKAGDTIELTLKFEKAGEIIVKAQVRDS